MRDPDERDVYSAETIFPIEEANANLHRQDIYAITGDLMDINVFPAGYEEPAQARAASRGEDASAVAHLRVADRFVWLDEEQVEALITALRLSRAAALARFEGRREL